MATLREKLQNNQAVSTGIMVVVLLCGVYLVYRNLTSQRYTADSLYFFDVGSSELIVVGGDELPPIQLSNGNEGVRAIVIGCGGCGDKPSIENIAYLQKHSDAGRAVRMKYPFPQSIPLEEVGPVMASDFEMVATLEMAAAGEWHPKESPQGNDITKRVRSMCGDGLATSECLPN